MELSAFLLPATLATFSVAFCIVWIYGSKAAFWWMLAYVSQCAAYLGEIVPTILHEAVQTLLVDAIFVVGFFSFGQAMCIFFEWPRRIRLNAGLSIAICTVVAWQVLVADSLKGELLAVDWGLAVLAAAPLALNLRALPQSRTDQAILAVTALTVLNCTTVSTAFAVLGDQNATFDSYMQSEYIEVSYTVTSLLNIIVPLVQLAVVALRAIEDQRNASETDPLTGLLNRRGFHRVVGDGATGALMIADIDHFKRVNDGFGHAVGDDVIAAFASKIKRRMPANCTVARFGGEEFVMFLPGADVETAAASVRVVNTMFGELVARRFNLPFTVTASFGVAEARGEASRLDEVMSRADNALYEAKKAGRNRIAIYGCSKPTVVPVVPTEQLSFRIAG